VSRQCDQCGARLSRYADADDTTCAPCYASTPRSYEDHLTTVALAIEQRGRGIDFCQRGHDLQIHGRMVHAGGGRHTRRCMLCRRERERVYAQNRRARLKEAA
jgi:hypothetical protein